MTLTLQDRITEARSEARQTCATFGKDDPQCRVAWDILEELQAEAAHHPEKTLREKAYRNYCDEFPNADECRMYDV
ncbi:Calvin cycle protein CP12 [Synechococcus elongatus]|uniref:Calvin cycle protein CP12 n=2 Tax=Synechococcus elongatus TaxID=32046 RepID=A0AAN1QKV3_SYNEL|nr:Calvin cycle protein CP12 [Synechococcus elongatus]AZB71378.1 hypothetical protein DOP62_00335 [Synechococcus elongatus PCC 11801]QFZ91222.1 hypothetical protein EKO22_01430 [Synechococcus elongatus PCC 11802]